MQRYMAIYGGISGAVVITSVTLSLSLADDGQSFATLEWLGYLIMLVALSMIFIAIKRYRDQELGGTITFGKATVVGLGTALVASAVYVLVWELYLAATDHAFIASYVDATIAAEQAKGISEADLATLAEEMNAMKESYGNFLFRISITFLEIFPVGFLITLVSAAILRRSSVLPAAD